MSNAAFTWPGVNSLPPRPKRAAKMAAGGNPVLSYLTSDRLPRMILRTFQWLLIIQWIMGWEPFGHLPLYMIFMPIIVDMVFTVIWPPQELKDAIAKAKRDAGLE